MLNLTLALPAQNGHIQKEFYEFIPLGSTEPVQTQIPIEWDEDWLNQSSFTYNHKVARVACALADISAADVAANPTDNALIRTYIKLGIEPSTIKAYYDINYDDPFWGNDQCAFSFAHTDKTLFIIIRPSPFESNEWISNINVSDATAEETSLHEGFLKPMVLVQNALLKYIESEKLDVKNMNLLITGYSRGAAVANLLAATFAIENAFPPENMFVYTFASPNVTTAKNTNDSQFKFIWNIVNAEDIVPTLPPNRNEWKFTKYGNILILANNWNKDSTLYEENFLPRINALFTQIHGRDYHPFGTGPFVPLQLTMMLTNVTKNVDNYYNGFTRLHKKGVAAIKKTDMKAMLAPETDEKNNSLMQKLSDFFVEHTGGVTENAAVSIKDMHACETYFSYLTALTQEEAFSTLGFSQVIIKGTPDGFIQDCEGNVLLNFQDGRVQHSSLKLPVAARNKGLDSMVIGFPATQDFKIYLSNTSLAPSSINAIIEQYDASGTLINTTENQKFYADISKIYIIDAGKITLEQNSLTAQKIQGDDKKELAHQTGLTEKQKARFTFEVNVNTEGHFGYGVHYGPAKIYLTLLTTTDIFNFGKVVDLQPGIGTQQQITGPLVIDLEALFKCTWFPDNRNNSKSEERFALIPSARASISFMPIRRTRIFAAGIADFRIDGFNDYAFTSAVRDNMTHIKMGNRVYIAPAFQFGIRF